MRAEISRLGGIKYTGMIHKKASSMIVKSNMQGMFVVTCMITYIFMIESLNSHICRQQLFQKDSNKKFIPDYTFLLGYGHLKSIEAQSATECNIECLKTSKCAQTNVEKLGARRWNCDLFGWGTGQTEDSPDHHHYVMIHNGCENGSKFFYNGSTYCVNQGPLGWTDAENKCIEDGSTLVAIETEDEQTAL
ncbi:unnamed protein product, partial [Owenia fusiformis]